LTRYSLLSYIRVVLSRAPALNLRWLGPPHIRKMGTWKQRAGTLHSGLREVFARTAIPLVNLLLNIALYA
jgi:hypothetical protein